MDPFRDLSYQNQFQQTNLGFDSCSWFLEQAVEIAPAG
jgi:hypothetical protein